MDRITCTENAVSIGETAACDPETLKRALESAIEDFENLGNVLRWLSHLFFDIGKRCQGYDDRSPELRLSTIDTTAEMGNYLATDWQATAESMARRAQEVLGKTEAAEASHE